MQRHQCMVTSKVYFRWLCRKNRQTNKTDFMIAWKWEKPFDLKTIYIPKCTIWQQIVFEFSKFNPLTPKIWLVILFSSCYTYPCRLVMRIWLLDQDNNFYLISLNILISCLLNNVSMLLGEVSYWSLLGVKGFREGWLLIPFQPIITL